MSTPPPDTAGQEREAFAGFDRLWTPHRLAYVAPTRDDSDPGCPFCALVSTSSTDDGGSTDGSSADGGSADGGSAEGDGLTEQDLVVATGERCFAVLNLHPYNPGHLMVLPRRHVADLEDLDEAESRELMTMTQTAIRVIREVSGPHAFNVGINLGGVAGGSLSQHLHQHVVPRWSGDANFITVVGGTKTLPMLLADTRDLLARAWPGSSGAGTA